MIRALRLCHCLRKCFVSSLPAKLVPAGFTAPPHLFCMQLCLQRTLPPVQGSCVPPHSMGWLSLLVTRRPGCLVTLLPACDCRSPRSGSLGTHLTTRAMPSLSSQLLRRWATVVGMVRECRNSPAGVLAVLLGTSHAAAARVAVLCSASHCCLGFQAGTVSVHWTLDFSRTCVWLPGCRSSHVHAGSPVALEGKTELPLYCSPAAFPA